MTREGRPPRAGVKAAQGVGWWWMFAWYGAVATGLAVTAASVYLTLARLPDYVVAVWVVVAFLLALAGPAVLLPLLTLGRSRQQLRRVWRPLAMGVAALMALAVVGAVWRVGRGPAVMPWTPTATALPDACAVLDSAGLPQHWPEGGRERDRDQPFDRTGEAGPLALSDCDWLAAGGGTQYGFVRLEIQRWSVHGMVSAAGAAVAEYAYERDVASGAVDVNGLGDSAFLIRESRPVGVRVVVWRANVTFVLTLRAHVDHSEAPVEPAARELAAGILRQISVD